MIFVTVGSQLPFDRLIKAVDEMVPEFGDNEVVAQVYDMKYEPRNIRTVEFLTPIEYQSYISQADLVISHAGMGTILTVSELGKPLIVFPRSGDLKETRNNHQVATCRMLEQQGLLHAAYTIDDLREKVKDFRQGKLQPTPPIPHFASTRLIESVRMFISGAPQELRTAA